MVKVVLNVTVTTTILGAAPGAMAGDGNPHEGLVISELVGRLRGVKMKRGGKRAGLRCAENR